MNLLNTRGDVAFRGAIWTNGGVQQRIIVLGNAASSYQELETWRSFQNPWKYWLKAKQTCSQGNHLFPSACSSYFMFLASRLFFLSCLTLITCLHTADIKELSC